VFIDSIQTGSASNSFKLIGAGSVYDPAISGFTVYLGIDTMYYAKENKWSVNYLGYEGTPTSKIFKKIHESDCSNHLS
jgi:hypothetical protein